jgi:formamidopyrimidine-DNA glycosylase
MPELPEVETISRGLRRRALGRRVTAIEVHHPGVIVGSPEEFVARLEGRSIVAVRRKGKALALEFAASDGETPRYLLVRLGMTGRLTVASRHAPLEPHTHVRLVLGDGKEELRFRDVRRFGRLRCCTREELEAVFGGLGPDAQRITEQQFCQALRRRAGALKSWLMNQQVLAGLGNIYADEALFAARIHPLTQPGRLSPEAARRLHRAVIKVLKRAIALGGTSFSDYLDAGGQPGRFWQRLRVYQRTGEPCQRCRHPIRRLVIAGRSSHFCPRCQPRPRRVAKLRGVREPAAQTRKKGPKPMFAAAG